MKNVAIKFNWDYFYWSLFLGGCLVVVGIPFYFLFLKPTILTSKIETKEVTHFSKIEERDPFTIPDEVVVVNGLKNNTVKYTIIEGDPARVGRTYVCDFYDFIKDYSIYDKN